MSAYVIAEVKIKDQMRYVAEMVGPLFITSHQEYGGRML